MMTAPKTSQKHFWQTERSHLLHRACLSLQAAIHGGKPVCKSLRRIARRYHGRAYQSDPSRTLQLSPQTLRRAWNAWRRGGEVASALRLRFQPAYPNVSARAMVRFADFCVSQRHPSLKTAWQRFMDQGRNRSLSISLNQVQRYFGTANFYLLQASLRSIEADRLNLARLRLKITADLRRRLPERVKIDRIRKEIVFEI